MRIPTEDSTDVTLANEDTDDYGDHDDHYYNYDQNYHNDQHYRKEHEHGCKWIKVNEMDKNG